MNLYKQGLMNRVARYWAPAGDGGSDAGGTDTGTVDRGDDFTPTDDDAPADTADKTGKTDPAPADLKNPFEDEDKDPEDEPKEAEDEPKDDDKKAKKDTRIPLNRHKEILAKERTQREALEQQLAQYQKGQQLERTNTELTKLEDGIVAMEKQYNKLLADGEVDKAADLMSKIRRAEREVVESKAEMRAQAAEIRARESARYDIVLERVEEAYPQLNPDADEYDKDMVADVADLKEVYEKRGNPPSKALQMAVKKLLGQEGRDQKTATDVAPRVTDKDIAADRKKAATQKTADAVKRTPPNTKDVGMDSDKAGRLTPKDVMNMSQDEFAKLGADQLAKMRGDVIA